MTQILAGKIALVTGGARGIGAAIVKRLAKDGAQVAFTYSKSKDAAEQLAQSVSSNSGVKVQAYLADANKPETLAGVVRQIVKDFGGLHILVNNAGVFTMGNIGETSEVDFQQVMRVNVDAVFATTNEAVKHMASGGRIINISSGLGERATGPSMSTYVGSKFAVTGLSRGWAKDLGAKGILVNAIQPGPIDTDMNPGTGEFADYMKSQTALGRYGTPDEIAGAVAFLAGPDATYISGATLNIDGGWNA